MKNDEQQTQKCVHSDRCRYFGCKHHENNNKSSAIYIGIIKEYEEMKNCTVWLD